MPLVDPIALARTYDHPSKDPWVAVRLHREATKRPDDWGSQRVASAINADRSNGFEGVSRSEIRTWVDGDGMPDAARAVEVARALGWTDDRWTDATEALAALVIGVYAFGSISETDYAPSWSPDDGQSRATIERALVCAGVDHQHVERRTTAQGDEIRPAEHRARLGRALVVAGAPAGDKNGESVRGLPGWIGDASPALEHGLAALLVRGRGVEHAAKATRTIQTDRGPRYFEDVARLVEAATGEGVTASDHGVTIPADAVRELGLA